MYKIGPNKFMGGGGVCGRGEKGGCVLFGMHFSQSKNARLLYYLIESELLFKIKSSNEQMFSIR